MASKSVSVTEERMELGRILRNYARRIGLSPEDAVVRECKRMPVRDVLWALANVYLPRHIPFSQSKLKLLERMVKRDNWEVAFWQVVHHKYGLVVEIQLVKGASP